MRGGLGRDSAPEGVVRLRLKEFMQFTELSLDGRLQKAIHDIGFEEMTPIQEEAIPPVLNKEDVVGSAQTGTGKTAAFVLPVLERLLKETGKPRSRRPQALMLAPTRELAIQIADHTRELAKHTPLKVLTVFGGSSISRQAKSLRKGVDIVVATPGRLMDQMRRGNVHFDDIKVLVFDEADRMMDMGFLPDMKYIVRHVPEDRQTLMFSATMPKAILRLAREFQRDPVKIDIETERPPETIDQALYPVPKHLKPDLLAALVRELDVDSMLVFTRTKKGADLVTRQLKEAGISVACIHGDFQQRKRFRSMNRFREGDVKVLVATNIAARGWDVQGISHVVNYDVPQHAETYIHRIGRTARWEDEGTAITLVTPDDARLIHRIEYRLGEELPRKRLESFNYDVPTPSWAKPSAEALLRRLHEPDNAADRWRSM